MYENLLFNLSLSFIIIHEMDAVRCKEWRIFPGLNLLDDKLGFKIFILAHIPLFSLLFWGLSNSQGFDNLAYYLELFFIVHLVLHLIYLKHPRNEFKDFISWVLIVSPAFLSSIDLVVNT